MKKVLAHFPLYLFLIFYIAVAFATYKTFPIANGEEFRILRAKETLDHFFIGEFKEKLEQPVPNYFIYNLYPMVMVLLNPNFYYEWFHLFTVYIGNFKVRQKLCRSLVYITYRSFIRDHTRFTTDRFWCLYTPDYFGLIRLLQRTKTRT